MRYKHLVVTYESCEPLKQQHLEHEAEQKRIRRNRFEESKAKVEQEARDRHENSVFLGNAHNAIFDLNQLTALSANHAAIVSTLSILDKSDPDYQGYVAEAKKLLSLMAHIRERMYSPHQNECNKETQEIVEEEEEEGRESDTEAMEEEEEEIEDSDEEHLLRTSKN